MGPGRDIFPIRREPGPRYFGSLCHKLLWGMIDKTQRAVNTGRRPFHWMGAIDREKKISGGEDGGLPLARRKPTLG